jgi:hypothetical protein
VKILLKKTRSGWIVVQRKPSCLASFVVTLVSGHWTFGLRQAQSSRASADERPIRRRPDATRMPISRHRRPIPGLTEGNSVQVVSIESRFPNPAELVPNRCLEGGAPAPRGPVFLTFGAYDPGPAAVAVRHVLRAMREHGPPGNKGLATQLGGGVR